MAEKRTKADKLLLNIECLERRYEARREPEVGEETPEPISTIPAPLQMEEQIRLRAYELFEAAGWDEARREPEVDEVTPEPISTIPAPLQMEEQIRLRAYDLFEARGCEHGHDREDWLQAEAEILSTVTSGTATDASNGTARKSATAA